MAQFRSTADILDLALRNAGEVTNGNSPYETQALDYLNRVHFTLLAGGTIPIGKDTTVEIDEIWSWAKSPKPLILELQPKITSGSISLTLGSETGTFTIAPTFSVEGWFLRVANRSEVFRIAHHNASSTTFELDSYYTGATGTALTYELFKLDYELVPTTITVDSTCNKIQFQKVAGTTITATLTHGTYNTHAALATHIANVMTTAAAGPTITGAYDTVLRKFSFTSDLAGPTIFSIVGNGTSAAVSIHAKLGFDDITTTSAATQTSVYALGGLCRIVEPIRIHKGLSKNGNVYGIDSESFQRNYPIYQIGEDIPSRFTVVSERADGTFTVRFNAYPDEKTRIEIEHVAVPRDLKDDAVSIPLVPRKHIDVLEDAATFYIMLSKSDDRAQVYSNLMQGKLKAMIAQHRGSLVRTGENFGQLISRPEARRRNFINWDSN